MARVSSYKDLLVWQKGMNLVESTYRARGILPTYEQWGLTSQMRRAAVSVPSNIAEGYGRQATGEYRHHLSIGRGSLLELETHVLLCERLRYLKPDEVKPPHACCRLWRVKCPELSRFQRESVT
ncbi:MAG: four helix bundle protein [Thermodesulfobacteriota bacterium]